MPVRLPRRQPVRPPRAASRGGRPAAVRRSVVAGCAALAAVLTASTATAAPEPPPAAADELRVMSLNLWHGGAQVNDGLAKQLALIEKPRSTGFSFG